DERVDRPRHLLRVSQHARERFAVVGRLALLPERELCLRDYPCEGCAELVRELGREALLAPEASREPLEQPVERRGQFAEFVVGLAEREAAAEIVLAPLGGPPCHAPDRAERGEKQPAGGESYDEQ